MSCSGSSLKRDIFFARALEDLPAELKMALRRADLDDACTLDSYPRMSHEELLVRGVGKELGVAEQSFVATKCKEAEVTAGTQSGMGTGTQLVADPGFPSSSVVNDVSNATSPSIQCLAGT